MVNRLSNEVRFTKCLQNHLKEALNLYFDLNSPLIAFCKLAPYIQALANSGALANMHTHKHKWLNLQESSGLKNKQKSQKRWQSFTFRNSN